MRYDILYPETDKSLLERLLHVRQLDVDHQHFLNPRFGHTWHDPFLLSDMQKAIDRIVTACKQQQHIVIFADYDVDGIVSSYLLFHFLTEHIRYRNVTIMYPDRLTDGYGLKEKHVENMHAQKTNLIITVDNGITSVSEVALAQQRGMDVIVTDHHHSTGEIPPAYAVVNPHTSPDYPFKGICGAAVAFKLMCALMETSTWPADKKKQLFQYYLPFVTIATVADCVPLVDENRVMVKQWIDMINRDRHRLPPAIKGFLDFCKIKEFEAFHIGFVIGPRINAWGRIASPHDSLKTLLHEGELQLHYLHQLDAINNERKRLQDEAFELAEELVDTSQPLLMAVHESFHEWIVGIVAGRLTEKYHKPSIVLTKKEKTLTGSLRAPEYFHIVQMLNVAKKELTRYGGHKQAWWMTVSHDQRERVREIFLQHCHNTIAPQDLIKVTTVDTVITHDERDHETLRTIKKCAPFGIGNPEPVFALQDVEVRDKKILKEKHTKLTVDHKGKEIHALFWREVMDDVPETISLVGTVQPDTFRGGYQLEGVGVITKEEG